MKKKTSKSLSPLSLAGNAAKYLMDKSIEGAADLFISSIKLGNELLLDGDKRGIEFVSFLFAHKQAVAEHFYPTEELRIKLRENPNDIYLKFDLYLAEKNKKRFFKKITLLFNFLPHQKYMTEKFLDKNVDLDDMKRTISESEILKNYSVLMNQLDQLESEEEIKNHKKELRYLIMMKIELGMLEGIEDYLDVARFAEVDGAEVLRGMWLRQIGDFEKAASFFSSEIEKNSTWAKEEFALMLDEMNEKNIRSKKVTEIRAQHFGRLFGSQYFEKLKKLPVNFLVIKKDQILKIMSIESEKNGERV